MEKRDDMKKILPTLVLILIAIVYFAFSSSGGEKEESIQISSLFGKWERIDENAVMTITENRISIIQGGQAYRVSFKRESETCIAAHGPYIDYKFNIIKAENGERRLKQTWVSRGTEYTAYFRRY